MYLIDICNGVHTYINVSGTLLILKDFKTEYMITTIVGKLWVYTEAPFQSKLYCYFSHSSNSSDCSYCDFIAHITEWICIIMIIIIITIDDESKWYKVSSELPM